MISNLTALNAIAVCSMAELSAITDDFLMFFSFDKDEDIRDVKQRLKAGLRTIGYKWVSVKTEGSSIFFILK